MPMMALVHKAGPTVLRITSPRSMVGVGRSFAGSFTVAVLTWRNRPPRHWALGSLPPDAANRCGHAIVLAGRCDERRFGLDIWRCIAHRD